MSHDLRTPLTSIMLYTEILLKNKCENDEQKVSYIQKIVLSEMVSYLEQQGFDVTLDLSWEQYCIQTNSDYIARIFDNLTSNIVKYAEPSEPVRIRETHSGHSVEIMMGNKKKELDEKIESSRIGLQNIQKMMEKMGGRAVVEQNGPNFAVMLLFNIRMAGEAGHSLFSMLPPPTPSK